MKISKIIFSCASVAGLTLSGWSQDIDQAGEPNSSPVFQTLFNFDAIDGSSPDAPLVQGLDGNFYGTTAFGSTSGSGTVFKITAAGKLTTLYRFCAQTNCTDGQYPDVLLQAIEGNLYGTAGGGGANSSGTVFKITPAGTLTTLYSFCAQKNCADGGEPSGLVQATDGNLYGATSGGGKGFGTVFKITLAGKLTTLHSFDGTTDGQFPGGLVQATDGNFYGTTGRGGSGACGGYGCGTIFEITPAGKLTILHIFDGADGSGPDSLVEAIDGNFYGTTFGGGAGGYGTVFEMSPEGALTSLYTFCAQANCPDGSAPGGLVQGTDGDLYGVTQEGGGGASCGGGCGTVFKITPEGKLTTLHSFDFTDGWDPVNALVQGTGGSFFGTTVLGGTSGACNGGCGTVFRLGVGLAQFIETRPTSGKVGTAVEILGPYLNRATSVTFNGIAAKFTAVGKWEITTTVPTGATTCKVEVKTSDNRTLLSNVVFRVTK